jgi:hypothetical protein
MKKIIINCLLRLIWPTRVGWNNYSITPSEPCIAFCVELPNGNYALVLESEEGGAEAELQYMEVIEDTEGTQANPADEGKPGCINLSVLKY